MKRAAALLSRLGRMSLNDALSYSYDDVLMWIEELVDMAESSASAPVYTLLKREDEKTVTEMAYDNPRFVEDVLREAVVRLQEEPRILWYRVDVVSHESIHNHDAFASVERSKNGWKTA